LADLQVTKVGPIDLSLLAHQGDQAKVGLGSGSGPMVGNEVTKMVGPALVRTRVAQSELQ